MILYNMSVKHWNCGTECESALEAGDVLMSLFSLFGYRNPPCSPQDQVNVGVSDDRLAAYGINAKKFKGKMLYGKKKDTVKEE